MFVFESYQNIARQVQFGDVESKMERVASEMSIVSQVFARQFDGWCFVGNEEMNLDYTQRKVSNSARFIPSFPQQPWQRFNYKQGYNGSNV